MIIADAGYDGVIFAGELIASGDVALVAVVMVVCFCYLFCIYVALECDYMIIKWVVIVILFKENYFWQKGIIVMITQTRNSQNFYPNEILKITDIAR